MPKNICNCDAEHFAGCHRPTCPQGQKDEKEHFEAGGENINWFFLTPYGSIRLWVWNWDPFIPALKKLSCWGGQDKSVGNAISFEFDRKFSATLTSLGYDSDESDL